MLFEAAGVLSQLEPAGLSRDDGKRSGRASIVPWKQSKSLIIQGCYLHQHRRCFTHHNHCGRIRAFCEAAEVKKRKNFLLCERLSVPAHCLRDPRLFRTGNEGFVAHLGRRSSEITGDPSSSSFLTQKLSVSIQIAGHSQFV